MARPSSSSWLLSSSWSSSSSLGSRLSCTLPRLAVVSVVVVALVEVFGPLVGRRGREVGRSRAHTPDHSCTHTPAYARTHTLSPSLLLAASLHPLTGKRGATISVVFWFWLGSARGSSGSGVLKTAEVSPACVPLLLLLLLGSCPLCFFFVLVVDASRSRVPRGTILAAVAVLPIVVIVAASDTLAVFFARELAVITFPKGKSLALLPPSFSFPRPEEETATPRSKTEPAALLRLPAAIVSPRLL